MTMTTAADNPIWIAKTQELCSTLLELPEFQLIRASVERFAADPILREQLTELNEKGNSLQQRQQFGVPLDDDEVAQFEALRDGFLDNPVARQFLDAQETMRRFQVIVGEHVAKTFELGRIPTAEDFPEGCGDDCGCDSEEE
jgi:cell fate (sporulation/competence/biofilm development) regulator YlbF (YheA/YmcA/DUF963 family)